MSNKEIQYKRIDEQIQAPNIKRIIQDFQEKIEKEIGETNPTAFWYRKKYEVTLPYTKGFNEKDMPTKARPIQMNQEYLTYCKKKIQDYLEKGLIRPSKSSLSCFGFYVVNALE